MSLGLSSAARKKRRSVPTLDRHIRARLREIVKRYGFECFRRKHDHEDWYSALNGLAIVFDFRFYEWNNNFCIAVNTGSDKPIVFERSNEPGTGLRDLVAEFHKWLVEFIGPLKYLASMDDDMEDGI